MLLVERIIRGVFFPEISARRYRLWALVVVSVLQSVLIFLLFSITSPLRALVLAVALPCAVAILFSPHLGVYIVATCIIGQWPWNLMRYLLMWTIASTVVWLLVHRKPLFLQNSILILTGLYLLLVLASTINPLSRVEMWSGTATYVGHFAVVWLVAILVDSRQAMQRVIWLMIFSGVVTAIIGLIQAHTHFIWPASTTYYELHYNSSFLREKSTMELQGWMGQFRVDSITGTPDYLALYFQTLMPFVGFLFVRQQSRSWKVMGLLILLLFGVVHFLSFTRGAILTTALVLILTGWAIDKRRFLVFGPTLALLVFLTLITWGPIRERVFSIFTFQAPHGGEAHMNTIKWRLLVLPVGAKMLFEHPLLGMGVGQQQYNWPASSRNIIPDLEKPVPIHNSYLQAGIDMGLGGLTVLLALMGATVRRLQLLDRRFQSMGEFEMADIARANLIAFIGIACAMLAYPLLESFRYFWLLIGVACALVRLESVLP